MNEGEGGRLRLCALPGVFWAEEEEGEGLMMNDAE
jgi:hypothetical protein